MYFPRVRAHVVSIGLAVSAVGLLVVALVAESTTVPGGVPQADLALGRKVFDKNCAECHGSKGKGDGAKAKQLGLHPRDLTLGVFKCHCSTAGQLPTDEDLMRTVTKGMPGTPMLAHGSLPEAERVAVVAYVKTLSPRFAAGNDAACPAAPIPPPPSPDLVTEGGHLYHLLQCDTCHGATGHGDGPAASTLKDDWGQPIKAYNFTTLGLFKCGNDDQDLFRTIQTGLSGTPMPSYRDVLLFAGDAFPAGSLSTRGTPDEVRGLEQYLATQPNGAAMGALSPDASRAIETRRTWALVRYVRSLLTR